ncbi:MAG: hypothetical protein LBN20_06190 [Endomicrobium sp.]|jgi:uncharacterized protein (DUF4415 family)|nr:hypothetical protein [Endomicrobium sp.]
MQFEWDENKMFDKDGYEAAPKDTLISLQNPEIIIDDLSAPEQLIRKEHKTSVPLDSQVINHFKEYAKQHNTQYQTAINDFLLSHISR